MAKVCEVCGRYSGLSKEIYLVELDYVILITSRRIKSIDTSARLAILEDYTRLSYDAVIGNYAVKLRTVATNHFVCSDECEDNVVKQPVFLRNDVFDAMGVYFCHNRNLSVSWKLSVNPQAMYGYTKKCDLCSRDYYSTGYDEVTVYGSREVRSSYYGDPLIDKNSGDICFSDFNEHNRNGHIFIYRDIMPLESKNFCSNDCRFAYCVNHNSLVFFSSILMNGFTVCITPDTKDANKNLHNAYSLRPQKLTPISYT